MNARLAAHAYNNDRRKFFAPALLALALLANVALPAAVRATPPVMGQVITDHVWPVAEVPGYRSAAP